MHEDDHGQLALVLAETLAVLIASHDLTAQREVVAALEALSGRMQAASPFILARLSSLVEAVRTAKLPGTEDFVS